MSTQSPLQPEDLAALAALARGQDWLRAVLCTLARRGVAFREAHPERAAAILDTLHPSPLFKAGQFLFDLMEWEDFMLDGPPPPVRSTTLDPAALNRLAGFLRQLKGHIDGAAGTPQLGEQPGITLLAEPAEALLPSIEPGFYLYHDVVLGVIRSAAGLLVPPA